MNRSSRREDVVKCFGKSYDELKDFSFESEDALKKALKDKVWSMVFKDFTPRTLTEKSVEDGGISLDKFRDQCINFLTRNYFCYFSQNQLCCYRYNDLDTAVVCVDFEDWHEKMCDSLLNLINERYKDQIGQKQEYAEVQYGKAQKIINMTFKYLYCFDCADKYLEKFVPCHMTIDAYTIDWVADVVQPLPAKHMRNSATIKWSKSFSKGNKNEKYTYLWYQDKIKNFLETNYLDQNNRPLMPLVAEFYAWPEEQWIKVTKQWLALDINQDYYPDYSDAHLTQYLEHISERAKKRNDKICISPL